MRPDSHDTFIFNIMLHAMFCLLGTEYDYHRPKRMLVNEFTNLNFKVLAVKPEHVQFLSMTLLVISETDISSL